MPRQKKQKPNLPKRQRQKKKATPAETTEDLLSAAWPQFAYIAGFTPNGFPFGTTWEELAVIEQHEADEAQRHDAPGLNHLDDLDDAAPTHWLTNNEELDDHHDDEPIDWPDDDLSDIPF